ncbi:MAG: hypothetical protein Kow0098_02140 [Ignavibacteriaceae bacterium]
MESEDTMNIDDLFDFPDEERKGYYEHNRELPYYISIDEKENAIDSLETALSFLDRKDNLKWKWFVLALHHSLYSFCVSSLEHGNYEQVLSKRYDDDENMYVKFGDDQPRKSKVVPFFIKDYKTPAYRIEWEVVESFPESKKIKNIKKKKEKLISFWTALARVQDNYYWMRGYAQTRALTITDEELYSICWLSQKVRNDLMHFIPKGYSIDILSIIAASKIFVKIIEYLAVKSYTINFLDYEKSQKRIKETLDSILRRLIVAEEIIYLSIIHDNQHNRCSK